MKKLSILICTIHGRETYFDRLKAILAKQVNDDVEVLVLKDNREKSIGEKRQKLLESATGEYISFIDDDDVISEEYIPLVLKAVESGPDVVGVHLLHMVDGTLCGLTYHSLKYKSWYHEPNAEMPALMNYYRNPNHLNPVKRGLALEIGFKPISMGEDKDYSMRLLPLLKTEEYIEKPIYTYLVRTVKEV